MHVNHVCTGTLEGQKKVSEALELKLQAVGGYTICMLVAKFWSSAIAAKIFNR